MNSASVELVETVDCTFDLYAMGPPHNMKDSPVMERLVVRSVAWAASTYPASVVDPLGCGKSGRFGSEIRGTNVPIGSDGFGISRQ